MRGWGQRDEPIQPANCVVALEVIDK
jgi:hypothetical protein